MMQRVTAQEQDEPGEEEEDEDEEESWHRPQRGLPHTTASGPRR